MIRTKNSTSQTPYLSIKMLTTRPTGATLARIIARLETQAYPESTSALRNSEEPKPETSPKKSGTPSEGSERSSQESTRGSPRTRPAKETIAAEALAELSSPATAAAPTSNGINHPGGSYTMFPEVPPEGFPADKVQVRHTYPIRPYWGPYSEESWTAWRQHAEGILRLNQCDV